MQEHVYPNKWVTLSRYSLLSGFSTPTFHKWKAEGKIAENKHYKKVNNRLIMVNLPAIEEWIENQH